MSFFKKLTSEFKELIGDKDEKPKQETTQHSDANRDVHPPTQPYPQQYPVASQQYTGTPQQYTGPPQQYTGPSQHYVGPPQHNYGGPPPDQSQLPPGWIRQWDQNSGRWYFIEQATGRSQWDPPHFGHAAAPYHAQTERDFQPHGMQPLSHEHEKEKDKKSGKGGMIAAGAGGLAIGALAGAALSGNSSDEEHGHTYVPASGGYYGGPAPPVMPLENNPGLSSSQRSSLEEARKDYEKAQREVAEDSDPSSSDVEELQEAREEYHSEVESAHEELDD